MITEPVRSVRFTLPGSKARNKVHAVTHFHNNEWSLLHGEGPFTAPEHKSFINEVVDCKGCLTKAQFVTAEMARALLGLTEPELYAAIACDLVTIRWVRPITIPNRYDVSRCLVSNRQAVMQTIRPVTFAVGQIVHYWKGARIDRPNSMATIRAFGEVGVTPCVWLDNAVGWIALTHIEAVESK